MSDTKGEVATGIELQTVSVKTFHIHIWKVLLGISIVLGVTAFIVVGFFFPECNSTQDRGFYSCNCKAGSTWDEYTQLCMCLDTGGTPAVNGCPGYENDLRYVFEDVRDPDAEYGGWSTASTC